MPWWAAWSADAIRVGSVPPEIERVLPRRMPAGFRYMTRIVRAPGGTAWLLSMDGERTVLEEIGADGEVRALPECPASIAATPADRVILLPGRVAAIAAERDRFTSWAPAALPAERVAPSGFQIRAIAADREGGLWVAGSRLDGASRRPALIHSGDGGETWESCAVGSEGLGAAVRAWLLAGRAEYRTVAAPGDWLVLTREYGDLGDEATILTIGDRRSSHWCSRAIDDLYRGAVEGRDGTRVVFVRGATDIEANNIKPMVMKDVILLGGSVLTLGEALREGALG